MVTVYSTAYLLSRKDLPGRKWISIFFIITMYFGGGLIPTYLVVRDTGLIYLQKEQYPFPLVLRGILITTEAMSNMTGVLGYAEANRLTELVKFASMIVAAAPILAIYPFVQKYFEQGFMTGAVKG